MKDEYILPHLNEELTDAQCAELVRIAEEASEVVQAAAKALRFGLYNYHPADPNRTSNFDYLRLELADLRAAFRRLDKLRPRI